MRYFLKKFILTLTSIYLLILFIPSLVIPNGVSGLLIAALIYGLLTIIIKPIVNILMLPINLVTLNLSSWILNIAIFFVWIVIARVQISPWTSPEVKTIYFTFSAVNLVKWQVTVVSAVTLVIINKLLNWTFRQG